MAKTQLDFLFISALNNLDKIKINDVNDEIRIQ